MLSSKSSCNQDPIPNYTPFPENDITSSSFFPNSPHMHFEYQDAYLQFLELFYQHQSITTDPNSTPTKMAAADSNDQNVVVEVKEDAGDSNGKATTIMMNKVRSSCSKKDRHSKINTARGPRDRRMRLSLDIARKFFDLQDLLGYDKASRTVEWLLRNSGAAITELARGRGVNPSSESSTCEEECEVVSSKVDSNNSSKNRMSKKVKRVVGRATVARESRRKARERARERTSQKRRLIDIQTNEELPKVLINSHSFKESHVSMDLSSDEARILEATNHQHHHQVCTAPWNPSTLFNYQDEQIEEFQFSGKPWEAFNSFNLSG